MYMYTNLRPLHKRGDIFYRDNLLLELQIVGDVSTSFGENVNTRLCYENSMLRLGASTGILTKQRR